MTAIAPPHQVEGLLGGQDAAMSRPGMIGMAVRDHGLVDRPGRIDMEAARLATEAGRGRQQNVFGAHPPKICHSCASASFDGPMGVRALACKLSSSPPAI